MAKKRKKDWLSNTNHSVLIDASKVPPSQFQRRKGSIYSTPSSRDSQHNNKERDQAYHEKLKEKKVNSKTLLFLALRLFLDCPRHRADLC